jgi:hypothetical protein
MEVAERQFRAAVEQRKEIEQDIAQRPPPGARRIRAERAFGVKVSVKAGEYLLVFPGDCDGDRPACGKDRVRVDFISDVAGDVGLAGKRERQRPVGFLHRGLAGKLAG